MNAVSRREELRAHVNAFHARHPDVWDKFVRYTFERIAAGYKHYSAAAIIQRIRWDTPAGGNGDEQFKINNNYAPFYARRFARLFPAHAQFFETRVQTSTKKQPRGVAA